MILELKCRFCPWESEGYGENMMRETKKALDHAKKNHKRHWRFWSNKGKVLHEMFNVVEKVIKKMRRYGEYMISDEAFLYLEFLESIKDKINEHNANMRDLIDAINGLQNSLAFAVSPKGDNKK